MNRTLEKAGIKGILFDKDGTLILFEESWKPVVLAAALDLADGDQAVADAMLNAAGFDTTTGKFTAGGLLAGGTADEVMAEWQKHLPGISVERFAEVEKSMLANQVVVPVDGMYGKLNELKRDGYKLGVATNDLEVFAHANLKQLGWPDLFDFVAGADSGFGGKPGPGMLHAFCTACDLKPQQVAMVGDNWQDMEMAALGGAGLKVGVLTGTSDRDTLEPLADTVLESAMDM